MAEHKRTGITHDFNDIDINWHVFKNLQSDKAL